MPKRTPEIAGKTAKRKVAWGSLRLAINKLRKYCEVEALQFTPIQSTLADVRTSRSVDKAQHYRIVSQCRVCNTGHVEMLARDFEAAKNRLPLPCAHNVDVVDLVLEERPETGLYPVTVPSIGELSRSLRIRGVASVASTAGSAVTSEKL